jgi:AcrR family transcriptional regulator
MARSPVLGNEEVLRRARSVFVERGYGARTKQIAQAVGLTWGAIALRFGSKWQLFQAAMAAPVFEPGDSGCEPAGADLPGLLARLHTHLWERWPQHLQVRLASRSPEPEGAGDGLADWLAAALQAHARSGAVRCDMPAKALAQVVLALMVGDVAQRFMARETTLAGDGAFIDRVACLLAGHGSPARVIHNQEPAWTDCNR